MLGPSHHVYLDSCALPVTATAETPVGNLRVDKDTVGTLAATVRTAAARQVATPPRCCAVSRLARCDVWCPQGKFSEMDVQTEEDEHSIEMQLPYIAHVLQGQDIPIVPIMVGSVSPEVEKEYGGYDSGCVRTLPPGVFTIARVRGACALAASWHRTCRTPPTSLSSAVTFATGASGAWAPLGMAGRAPRSAADQCGVPSCRFGFQPHNKRCGDIWQSIEVMDHDGMQLIEAQDLDGFRKYLRKTRNTICGRHPINVRAHASR